MFNQFETYPGFICHFLNDRHMFYSGTLPPHLLISDQQFDELWNEHPHEFHEIMIHGRLVKTPRWQQAYGKDYHYTGNVNKALPIPKLLQPMLSWSQNTFDPRLNGILLNWYDGSRDHYIGAHRDSTTNMCDGAPIVTISLGQERAFRLRPWKERGKRDFPARNGTVFVMPFATNKAWTHEVPKAKRYRERRISVTLRAFA
jgi:alkylated DNA repair dioxygenase AlkB